MYLGKVFFCLLLVCIQQEASAELQITFKDAKDVFREFLRAYPDKAEAVVDYLLPVYDTQNRGYFNIQQVRQLYDDLTPYRRQFTKLRDRDVIRSVFNVVDLDDRHKPEDQRKVTKQELIRHIQGRNVKAILLLAAFYTADEDKNGYLDGHEIATIFNIIFGE